ncbi:MAG: response regulator RpfG family c-di-GMP phosphodiesterase [Glaciecola sp.]|jgi:response regulator RpfG family c-di-GMP phosphodiesterase
MGTTRSYHRTKQHHQIMEIIDQESGSIFDPDILPLFYEVAESSDFKATSVE